MFREKILRNKWLSEKVNELNKQKFEEVLKEYQEKFPDTYVTYLEANGPDLFTDYIYQPDCYELDEVTNEQVIKDECKEKIERGEIRPTIEKYIEENFHPLTEADILTDELKADYIAMVRPLIKDELLKLADTKTQEVKDWLAGKHVTPGLEERYRSKAETIAIITDKIQSYAIENNIQDLKEAAEKLYNDNPTVFEDLELEAERKGITPLELYFIITSDANTWTDIVRKKNVLIDAFRVIGNDLIERMQFDQLDIVDPLFKDAYAMKPEDIEKDKIEALFAKYGI